MSGSYQDQVIISMLPGIAFRRLVLLADARVQRADVHDLDRGVDAHFGQLRLEDLHQLLAVAARPDKKRGLQRVVHAVAEFGQKRLELLRVVGRSVLGAEILIVAEDAAGNGAVLPEWTDRRRSG